jgi:NAD(P)-dependent dehydrogenase (short-subunit alcohol dehydrogenase family)
MRLKDKIAIVTGAAAGIGAATARLFAAEGARVAVADFDEAGAERIAAEIGAAAIAIHVDVTREPAVKAMVERTVAAFGGLDILVNNAGRGTIGTVETTELNVWNDIFATNVTSVYLCSRYAVPVLRGRGGGVIVNTASNVASFAIRDRAAYVAAKGAVASLTRAMALDHAADGIRVNSVAPGVILSSYYDRMLETVPDPDAFVKALEARAPMGRTGRPEEIASAIAWLASAESSFATGAMFTIDGGATAW